MVKQQTDFKYLEMFKDQTVCESNDTFTAVLRTLPDHDRRVSIKVFIQQFGTFAANAAHR